MTGKDYKRLYRIMDSVSPVPFDCGKICGAACCQMTEKDMGIFLFPGEETVRNRLEWESYEELDQGVFVKCKGPEACDRTTRPIQCRTFPLFPLEEEDGGFNIVFNVMELPYSCPLIDAGVSLDPEFIRVTKQVWEELLQSPEVVETIRMFF